MELTIRQARLDDAAQMVQVLNPIIESGLYTVLDAPLTTAQQREFIANFPGRGVFHVAERVADGALVGLQDVMPFGDQTTRAFDHVGVMATFVDLALRRHGIGKQLFPATFAAAKAKGYEKIFTYIRADNLAARAAYLQQGFRVIGTAQRHARVRGRLVDEILVERFL